MTDSSDGNTKAALLTTATEVFAEKGYDSATVRDICGRAKANVAAVNYHYGSKDGLYAAVLEDIFPAGKEWKAPTSPNDTPEGRLREFIHGLVHDIYERGSDTVAQHWAIFLREMANPSQNLDFIVQHQVQPRADELRSILTELLGPATSKTTLAFCSSSIWAMALDLLLIQPILDRLTPMRPAVGSFIDEFTEHVTCFALGGLQALKQSYIRSSSAS